jgi:hypothetical protein
MSLLIPIGSTNLHLKNSIMYLKTNVIIQIVIIRVSECYVVPLSMFSATTVETTESKMTDGYCEAMLLRAKYYSHCSIIKYWNKNCVTMEELGMANSCQYLLLWYHLAVMASLFSAESLSQPSTQTPPPTTQVVPKLKPRALSWTKCSTVKLVLSSQQTNQECTERHLCRPQPIRRNIKGTRQDPVTPLSGSHCRIISMLACCDRFNTLHWNQTV